MNGNGIGEITRIQIGQNDDQSAQIRRLILKAGIEDNALDLEHIGGSGEDSAPIIGDSAIILEIADDYRIVIAIDDGITPVADPGEKIIYSHDSTGKLAFIKLGTDGSISLGNQNASNPADYAVLYNKLKDEFNELKGKFNALVQAYVTHMHPTAALGPPSVPTNSASSSLADITRTKSNYVKLDQG